MSLLCRMLEDVLTILNDKNRQPYHLEAANRILRGVALKDLQRLYYIKTGKNYITLNFADMYSEVLPYLEGQSAEVRKFLQRQVEVSLEERCGVDWEFPFDEEELNRNLGIVSEFTCDIQSLYDQPASKFNRDNVTKIRNCLPLVNLVSAMQEIDYKLMRRWIPIDKIDRAFVLAKFSQICARYKNFYYLFSGGRVVKSIKKPEKCVVIKVDAYVPLSRYADIDKFWWNFFALILCESGEDATIQDCMQVVQEALYAAVFDIPYIHSLRERVIIPNVVVRVNSCHCYYFGTDNIVHTVPLCEARERGILCDTSLQVLSTKGREYGLRPLYCRPLPLVNARYRSLIKSIHSGQSYEELFKVLHSKAACCAHPNVLVDVMIRKRPDWSKIIGSIGFPEFFNSANMDNKTTFDCIEVRVNLLRNWYGTDVVNKMRPFARELNSMIVDSLRKYSIFMRNPGLLENMQIIKVEFNRDYTMTYQFKFSEGKYGTTSLLESNSVEPL